MVSARIRGLLQKGALRSPAGLLLGGINEALDVVERVFPEFLSPSPQRVQRLARERVAASPVLAGITARSGILLAEVSKRIPWVAVMIAELIDDLADFDEGSAAEIITDLPKVIVAELDTAVTRLANALVKYENAVLKELNK